MSGKRSDAAPVVGIDLGGTNMAIGVVDAKGTILGRCKRKTKAADGRDIVLSRLVEGVMRACDDAKIPFDSLRGVGIGAPSAIDVPAGRVIKAGNLGWEDFPLRDALKKLLGKPVFLDNDVNVAAWGEHRAGVARGRNDLLAVWVGTGVGGGLIFGGKLHHGSFWTAGEIGHVILLPGAGPGRETVEDLCSRTGLAGSLRRLLPMYPDSALHRLVDGNFDANFSSSVLAEAYEREDPLVRKVVNHAADLLGLAIANWITLLAIDTVVLGGGVTEALGKPFAARVRKRFEEQVFPATCRKCEILVSELGDSAGVVGAAMLVPE